MRRLHTDGSTEVVDYTVPAGHVLLIRDIVANAPSATGSTACFLLQNEASSANAQFGACVAPVNGSAGIREHFSTGVEFDEGGQVFANTIGATTVVIYAYGVLTATQ